MTTILVLHVLVALGGIAAGAGAFFKRSLLLIRLSYALVALTIASGTYLVLSSAGQLTSSCISGLVYLAVVSTALVPARQRLSRQQDN